MFGEWQGRNYPFRFPAKAVRRDHCFCEVIRYCASARCCDTGSRLTKTKIVSSYFSACAFSSSNETHSSAEECVASRSTGAATPRLSASFQRATQTHHLSPGSNPGNPHSGCGVTKSFPSRTEKSRNSRVACTHTVC